MLCTFVVTRVGRRSELRGEGACCWVPERGDDPLSVAGIVATNVAENLDLIASLNAKTTQFSGLQVSSRCTSQSRAFSVKVELLARCLS
jgi:hypothetical protein